jgi:putative transposase
MRYTQSEKMEIIRMVEESALSVKETLLEIGVSRSTFYQWYKRYQEHGYEGLRSRHRSPPQIWNKIPEWERQRVLDVAREFPEKSSRELACYVTDKMDYFISESSVYRILKAYDLVTSPVYTVVSAKDEFENPTRRINQLWQTDFCYLKVIDWGWYYLSTVMDDYSRYILAWRLCQSMMAEDVKKTLDMAIEWTGVKHVHVVHRPRLLSDNGSAYVSKELRHYLQAYDIHHIRSKPYHPMTQGKIERYHRSMKNLILLDHYYSPSELEERIREWVDYYNNHRYHEAINNVTPSDKYFGRDKEILKNRMKIKKQTIQERKKINKMMMLESLPNEIN